MNIFKRGLFFGLLIILAVVLIACSEDVKETKKDDVKVPTNAEESKVDKLQRKRNDSRRLHHQISQ